MQLLKQKNILLAPILVLVVALIFGVATLGSTVNPVPQHLPVLLVQSDQGTTVPGQGDINYGQTIADNLTGAASQEQATASPFDWEIVPDEAAGLDMLDRQEAYALVVIPQTLSGSIGALMTGSTEAANIPIYVNQGKNMSAASMTSQGLTQIFQAVNAQFSKQLTGVLAAQGVKVDPGQIAVLANPLQAKVQIVNPVGTHSVNGNAPGSLTQIAWMAALVATILVFFAKKNLTMNSRKDQAAAILSQVLAGAVLSLVAGFGILAIADGMIGLQVSSFLDTALFLSLAAFCFFLMMSAIMAWLGFAGVPIFMLLFFFTGPLLTLAPEMLPQATKNLLFSWVPLRFSVEGLRDLFYFGQGLNIQTPLVIVCSIAAGSLILLLASMFKRPKQTKEVSLNREVAGA
ncbi:YhgE/Pip-like protein [Paenibacillus phyllosphaerae]|uniref:YhgE/Pip-like protein n=1 Tax=Paenibacillus phyllosphaerae TaxID=274593 RepID=A0A7W5AZZ9_9BACL|nr:DUF3533 domain-containing protein [Paenibacillus phyllosphaerae]MBB3111391.1 YhgE/Pip-like protein [Paenibacillus phyllosphaerae]